VCHERGGGRGLELANDLAWLVAGTPADFADKIARVHEDEAFNRALSAAGLAYIERRCSAAAVKEALQRGGGEGGAAGRRGGVRERGRCYRG
jgi:hypothetical protein